MGRAVSRSGTAWGRRAAAWALALTLCLTGCAVMEAPVPPPSPEATPTPTATPERRPFTLPCYPAASLHPVTGNNRSNLVLASLVYQGLFELDNTFTSHAVLCSSYTASEDGLTWTFALKSAAFSDGAPLTAADVVSSLELARTSALYAQRLAQVERVAENESGAVVVSLTQPNGALPALLDIPIVRETGDGSPPLGTGPYAFAQDGGEMRLVRRDTAPGAAPAEIPLYPVDGSDELIYAFDAGEISLVVSDLTGSNALGYASGYEVFDSPATVMLYVGFRADGGPCRDPLLRQALSRSFDRDTVTLSLLAGHAAATCLPFSPDCALTSASHESAGRYDTGTATELLSQAGYAAGEDGLLYQGRTALSLTFVVNSDNAFKLSIAEYLTGQLAGMGITVDLKKLHWDDYLAALAAGDFDLYLGEVTLTADFDLTALLGRAGNMNYGGYESRETDALLDQLRAAQGSARTGAASALLDQFQADAPLTVLCFKNHSVLTRWRAVSGLAPTRQNPFYHLENLRFGPDAQSG